MHNTNQLQTNSKTNVPGCSNPDLHETQTKARIMTKTKTIQFYADPGHGWAKVKKSELATLGIAHQISPYSYERGDYAYLEEDCDLSLYIDALRARGCAYKFVGTTCANRSSRIRSYSRYSA